jgi:hypothetical protein
MKRIKEKPICGFMYIILIGILALAMLCLIFEFTSSWIGQKRFLSLREDYQEMAYSSQSEILILEEKIGEKKLDAMGLDLIYMRLLDVEWDGVISWSNQDKYVDLLFRQVDSSGTSTEEIYQDLYLGEEIKYQGYKIKLERILSVDWSPWIPFDSSTYGFFKIEPAKPRSNTSITTATPTPTPTPTPTAVLVPTPEPIGQPTPTQADVLEGIFYPHILGLSQPLRELLINWEDIEEYYVQTDLYPQISIIFEDWEFTVRDASGEISDDCVLECTRQIWRTETRTDIGLDGKEFDYYREVIIEMYLQEDASSASEHAVGLFDDYLPELMDEEDPEGGRHRHVSAPEQNTRIGILYPREDGSGMYILVTTSVGPISYRITSNIPPWHDDGGTEIQLTFDFLNTQISQVEKAYIFPSLSDLTLSREDILDVINGDSSERMFVDGLIDTDSFNIFDRTDEIETSCQTECTRQEIASYDRGIIITLVRAEVGKDAEQEADQLYAELKPYPDTWEADTYARGFLPPDHTRIGFSNWNKRFIVVSWVGPIAIRVEKFGPSGDDAYWENGTIIAFANLQLEKLNQANVIP